MRKRKAVAMPHREEEVGVEVEDEDLKRRKLIEDDPIFEASEGEVRKLVVDDPTIEVDNEFLLEADPTYLMNGSACNDSECEPKGFTVWGTDVRREQERESMTRDGVRMRGLLSTRS